MSRSTLQVAIEDFEDWVEVFQPCRGYGCSVIRRATSGDEIDSADDWWLGLGWGVVSGNVI
jgi:hypothetical protein